jgi:hypothetical protein
MSTIIGTRRTMLFLDTGPIDFTAEVSTVKLVSGEQDSTFMSFVEARAGGARDYTLDLVLRQDTAAASLWYYLWNSAGDDITYEFWPNGQNSVSPTTPTATYPKFSGTVTITEPDGDLVGGEAKRSTTAVNTIKTSWQFTGKPVLDVS